MHLCTLVHHKLGDFSLLSASDIVFSHRSLLSFCSMSCSGFLLCGLILMSLILFSFIRTGGSCAFHQKCPRIRLFFRDCFLNPCLLNPMLSLWPPLPFAVFFSPFSMQSACLPHFVQPEQFSPHSVTPRLAIIAEVRRNKHQLVAICDALTDRFGCVCAPYYLDCRPTKGLFNFCLMFSAIFISTHFLCVLSAVILACFIHRFMAH